METERQRKQGARNGGNQRKLLFESKNEPKKTRKNGYLLTEKKCNKSWARTIKSIEEKRIKEK